MKHIIILFVTVWTVLVQGKVDIRQTNANKAFMGRMKEGEYEVVHPFQIRDKNERIGIDTRNYFLKAQEHYSHVTFVMRTTMLGRLKLVLERNNFIFLNQTSFHKLDSDGERLIQQRIENCYYQGTVGGEDDSFVVLSTCNGIRGIISFSNGTTYGVWPLDRGDNNGKRHPHILYKTSWSQEAHCGTSLISSAQRLRRAHHKQKRDVSKRTKYVEVALIGDYEFMKHRGLHEVDAITYMLDTINIADYMLSRDLNIRLSVVYVEVWTDVQRIDLHEDIQRTMSGLIDYSNGHIYHIQKDTTLLFTGGSFANNEVSNAGFRSVCTARSTQIVKALDEFSTAWSAQMVAQSTGHLLGLEHDTSACSCEPVSQCVMNVHPGSMSAPFTWQFSKCSIARMHGIWQDGNVQCLLNKPFQVSELRECGNGVVDGTEECDCGGRENCEDPCCDPLTCTLKAHAQCAAHHKCCHRCELKKAGEVCRGSRSSCDVAEQCDGVSGDCPADGHLIDGTVCGRNGQCWRGNCTDATAQCMELWGADAKLADDACFEQNTRGYEYANCGLNPDGSPKSCRPDDLKCGTLHCQGGAVAPTNAILKAFTFHFSHKERQIQCKSIADTPTALIGDGAHCGSGRVCVAGSCVEMSSVTASSTCPTNNLALLCSGHGHCTTTSKCVCFNGWSGKACDLRSNSSNYQTEMGHVPRAKTTDVETMKIGTTLETLTLLAILVIVGLGLLLILIILLFCYRRRSIVEIPFPSDEKLNEESPERAIKFGNMPSYREEKRKKKSTKRIYGALNRITEADERDSTSLRSRESAGSQLLVEQRPGGGRPETFIADNVYAESMLTNRSLRLNDIAEAGYPLRSFGSWRSSAPISPASSSGQIGGGIATPLRLNKIGQILRNMQSDDDEELHNLNGSKMNSRFQRPELKEQESIEMDHDHGSNTESSRGDDMSDTGKKEQWDSSDLSNNQTMVPPVDFRQSPSLFSDPFKLEMSNSMHT